MFSNICCGAIFSGDYGTHPDALWSTVNSRIRYYNMTCEISSIEKEQMYRKLSSQFINAMQVVKMQRSSGLLPRKN